METLKFQKSFELKSSREDSDWKGTDIEDGMIGTIALSMTEQDLKDFINSKDISKIMPTLEFAQYMNGGKVKKVPLSKDKVHASIYGDIIKIEVMNEERYPSRIYDDISIEGLFSFFEKQKNNIDKTSDEFIYRALDNGATAIYQESNEYGENVYRIYDAVISNLEDFEKYEKAEEKKLVRHVSIFKCVEHKGKLYSCDATMEPNRLLNVQFQKPSEVIISSLTDENNIVQENLKSIPNV